MKPVVRILGLSLWMVGCGGMSGESAAPTTMRDRLDSGDACPGAVEIRAAYRDQCNRDLRACLGDEVERGNCALDQAVCERAAWNEVQNACARAGDLEGRDLASCHMGCYPDPTDRCEVLDAWRWGALVPDWWTECGVAVCETLCDQMPAS